ncbi:hypothetical protein NSA56_14515 [Oceanobacillus caeni]|uniref:hypothetical protein n=1 Tax=Bacillaceae TaxID=186817 RepID=UPI001C22C8F1|nr:MULTISPECIES: hypothetical protein [Oceanobacillus]MBU8791573.1 hypothetical protein [Oceanobacillus caeni]MCR1835572.1 hypothetical protein [Oceanobacillus caeni]MCT1905462.1 hypothetical protein [Oceanobacillus sojae]
MITWLENNKRFIIGFLATVTTTILFYIFYLVIVNQNVGSIESFVENQVIDNQLLFMVTLDILAKIMIGISAVYFILVVLKFLFDNLRKQVKGREKA